MVLKDSYSDVAFVEGVYSGNPMVERALYVHCKRYFDRHYMAVFFAEEEIRNDIFQESFIKLWENIEQRRIYVEDGAIRGKGGKSFSGSLTTYLMGIARLKFLEWSRKNPVAGNYNDNVKKGEDGDDEGLGYEALYDDGQNAMIDIIADCICHMSERCREILTLFWYKEKSLDDIMVELPTYKSKDALKTEKYKCMTNLKQSAHEIYDRYVKV
ncbi:MAG: sigma-70 family RNA polymerase sigma factor [Muribaculaceae bacterium]|nr:sigma-70 family RNA polymerase sigma factor [Muribaculaceae bacterium]